MEEVGTTEENKMGTKPVWSLLMTMALPVVLSTAVQSLYNVVDGIFVSQISEDAMAAITFANPLVTILIAVAVFGACCRVTGFCYAILNALCSATIPIIAYNHGAKKKKRIDQTIRFGYLYAVTVMAVGTVFCVGFPEMFLRLFNATDEMIGIGIWGMRMLTCCYVLCAVRNMSNCILQALGHSVTAMACDLSRNYLILIPAAWLLSLTGILDAVWLSVPAADIVSAATGFLLMLRFYRRDMKPMQG